MTLLPFFWWTVRKSVRRTRTVTSGALPCRQRNLRPQVLATPYDHDQTHLIRLKGERPLCQIIQGFGGSASLRVTNCLSAGSY